MNEIYGYRKALSRFPADESGCLEQIRGRRTFVTHRSIPCSFLFSLVSFQSNLFCSKAKPCQTTKETFFNRNNTAQISQSRFTFRREVELLYPTALLQARFFSPSFRSNQICCVPKQSRVEIRKKQRPAHISQSLPDSKTSSLYSRLDKSFS